MQQQKVSMGKKKFRIGDLAKELRLKKYIIRFWEKEFDLESDRSEGGQRFYTQDDFDTFSRIKDLLYAQGYTISGAKKQLSVKGATVTQENSFDEATAMLEPQEAVEVFQAAQEDVMHAAEVALSAPVEQIVPEQAVVDEIVLAAYREKEEELNQKQHAFRQKMKELKGQLQEFKELLG